MQHQQHHHYNKANKERDKHAKRAYLRAGFGALWSHTQTFCMANFVFHTTRERSSYFLVLAKRAVARKTQSDPFDANPFFAGSKHQEGLVTIFPLLLIVYTTYYHHG
jgi:hypothetical protein